ncbi:hypothetical protein GH733_004599 [Mirounga leonina]|nr:hypothetical protein GH733_004811 [Mirounga leonina]KAF3828693.1 hypothetical protein GH733_004599 [Mirounga leonina]
MVNWTRVFERYGQTQNQNHYLSRPLLEEMENDIVEEETKIHNQTTHLTPAPQGSQVETTEKSVDMEKQAAVAMMAQGSLVANRGRRFQGAIELSGPGGGSRSQSDQGSGQGDLLYPVGYFDKQMSDTSVQETERTLVEKRCWDIALGPLKQIPMNLFFMYMAANFLIEENLICKLN